MFCCTVQEEGIPSPFFSCGTTQFDKGLRVTLFALGVIGVVSGILAIFVSKGLIGGSLTPLASLGEKGSFLLMGGGAFVIALSYLRMPSFSEKSYFEKCMRVTLFVVGLLAITTGILTILHSYGLVGKSFDFLNIFGVKEGYAFLGVGAAIAILSCIQGDQRELRVVERELAPAQPSPSRGELPQESSPNGPVVVLGAPNGHEEPGSADAPASPHRRRSRSVDLEQVEGSPGPTREVRSERAQSAPPPGSPVEGGDDKKLADIGELPEELPPLEYCHFAVGAEHPYSFYGVQKLLDDKGSFPFYVQVAKVFQHLGLDVSKMGEILGPFAQITLCYHKDHPKTLAHGLKLLLCSDEEFWKFPIEDLNLDIGMRSITLMEAICYRILVKKVTPEGDFQEQTLGHFVKSKPADQEKLLPLLALPPSLLEEYLANHEEQRTQLEKALKRVVGVSHFSKALDEVVQHSYEFVKQPGAESEADLGGSAMLRSSIIGEQKEKPKGPDPDEFDVPDGS